MAELKRKKVVEIERTGRKVKRKKNEDSRPERETTFNDLTKAFGAQAVGLLVGGLLGGRDGAIQGGQQGAVAGKALNTVLDSAQARDDKRHDAEFEQDLKLDSAVTERFKAENTATRNSIQGDTLAFKKEIDARGENSGDRFITDPEGNRIFLKEVKGNFIDPRSGQIVPGDKARSLKAENQDSLMLQRGETILNQQQNRVFKADAEVRNVGTAAITRFEADPVVKKAKSVLSEIDVVDSLASKSASGNEVATGILPAKLAKGIAGEVGNLTPQDKEDALGAVSALRRLKVAAARYGSGKIPESLVKDLQEVSATLRNVQDKLIESRAQREAERLQSLHPRVFGGDTALNFITGREQVELGFSNRQTGLERTQKDAALSTTGTKSPEEIRSSIKSKFKFN